MSDALYMLSSVAVVLMLGSMASCSEEPTPLPPVETVYPPYSEFENLDKYEFSEKLAQTCYRENDAMKPYYDNCAHESSIFGCYLDLSMGCVMHYTFIRDLESQQETEDE